MHSGLFDVVLARHDQVDDQEELWTIEVDVECESESVEVVESGV